MNTLLDTGQAAPGSRQQDLHERPDPEISLGTSTILGIFFALAVLCAAFFGFGYSLGVKHIISTAPATAERASASAFSSFKPSPDSPLAAGSATPATSPETVSVPYSATPDSSPAEKGTGTASASQHAPPQTGAAPLHPAPKPSTSQPASAALPVPADPTAGQSMVQVAAVSHQEDADLIASTLKRRGYAVAIRHEPQDKLLHLQLGPFPAKKDAEAMRQRLLADGFNAYIK